MLLPNPILRPTTEVANSMAFMSGATQLAPVQDPCDLHTDDDRSKQATHGRSVNDTHRRTAVRTNQPSSLPEAKPGWMPTTVASSPRSVQMINDHQVLFDRSGHSNFRAAKDLSISMVLVPRGSNFHMIKSPMIPTIPSSCGTRAHVHQACVIHDCNDVRPSTLDRSSR